jgi:DNA-directed RNA polymerase III subunit RPC2
MSETSVLSCTSIGHTEKRDTDDSAGQMLGLLFEDALKTFNADLKRRMDKILEKKSRAGPFEGSSLFVGSSGGDSNITTAFVRCISTGNWSIKRFHPSLPL